ncbi:MAG TPA: ATP-binding protein [Jatrophihabitantaceae bacterium]|jgi:hypothetical protein
MNRPLAPGSRLASTKVFTRHGTRIVDLRDVRWVDPVHLVSVAAEAEAAHREGLSFELRGPSAPDRARYASRMKLGEVVSSLGGTHDLPPVTESRRVEHLVEVARLRTSVDVVGLATLVHSRVIELDADLAHALHQGVAEIGQNVCDHAQSVGFVAAQTIPRRGELRFAVADPGVGLLATLRARGASSDSSAIDLALTGVSRLPGGGRGTGLPSTVRAVTHLGGYLYLASGGSAAMLTQQRRTNSGGPRFAGTLVEGRVPTGRLVRGTMDSRSAEGGG